MTYNRELAAALYWIIRVAIVLIAISGLAAIGLIIVAIDSPDRLAGIHLTVANGGPPIPITEPGVAPTMLALLLIGFIAIGFILQRLASLIATVKVGAPFVADNVGRLRGIAWVLVGLAVSEPFAALAIPTRLSTPLGFGNGTIDVTGLFSALVILVLAEVFREGARLREDQEGTV